MSLRSEVKWEIIARLKKPLEHCLKISLFELNTAVPSIHEHLSIDTRPDKGYESFEVLIGNTRLQTWQYDKDNCCLRIPLVEVQNIAQGTSCKLSIRFKETNALVKLGDSYLYAVEYNISKLFATSLQMKISCPELRGGRQERLYKGLAKLFRIKRTSKMVSVGKEPVDFSENELRSNFHFRPNESPSFKMLFAPVRFDFISIILGIVGIIALELIAASLAKNWFGL